MDDTTTNDRLEDTRKPYTKPQIQEVPLRPDEAVLGACKTASVSGPINATAPNPVTNAEFARALGRALHRPALLPAPAFALRLLLGEMAEALLLSGQRAVPAKAAHLWFTFRYPLLDDALGAIFKAGRTS